MSSNESPTADACLEILGVRKVYKSDLLKQKQVVIDNLTCRFLRGRCTGLLGHNGAGKTTTIRMILGLAFPDTGEIRFEGMPISTASKRQIGYMPEVNKLAGALTPHEVLHRQLQIYRPEHAASKKARTDLVDAKLEEVGLTPHRHKKTKHLSKGMARRLAWAQATIHKPKLLVLDEPASGLDPLGRRHMLNWIEREKASGTSIVLCTHELMQVQVLCDDLHILNRGRLVFSTQAAAAGRGPQDLPLGNGDDHWRHRYNIHISGADEASLKRLGEARELLPWQGFRQDGYLGILGFAEYVDATAWLAACLGEGFVVVRFGDETFLAEDELLPYFEGSSG